MANLQSISYVTASSELGITSIRELEDLIIDVMYAGLLGGKMHHDEKVLHVDWVNGRDVNPASLPDLANALQNWYVLAFLHLTMWHDTDCPGVKRQIPS
jgi:COP9 signalosome complex subunit 7